MAKLKAQTPQELYRARKQREEQERRALLPPGLINHGNTCFMNSVLEGLIATRLLSDLVHFNPVDPSVQRQCTTQLASRRSPQLTNGHKLGGRFEQQWVEGMPIGDVFTNMMHKAWDIQSHRERLSLNPRPILNVLGQKYDQYLDFAQQDAHEFLRIFLDAMRMEESDIIKKRQPPSPSENVKKRRRTTIPPFHHNSPSHVAEPSMLHTHPVPQEETLMSLVDMIFGGKLTSILVCQKCKHVSQTYEDFNDISLSIKPEDYRERKRDRLKNLAKRLTSFSTTTLAVGYDAPRSSSVPPRLRERDTRQPGSHDEPLNDVDVSRWKSIDVVADQTRNVNSEPSTPKSTYKEDLTTAESDGSNVIVNGAAPSEKHIETVDTPKPEKKEKKADSWARIGRRISMTVGLGKAPKEDSSRSKERVSADLLQGSMVTSKAQINEDRMQPHNTPPGTSIRLSGTPETAQTPPPIVLSRPPSLSTGGNMRDPIMSPRPSSPAHSSHSPTTRFPNIQRTKSPKPPKPSPEELEYLRRILVDITPASSTNPFTLFKPTQHINGNLRSVSTGAAAASSMWLSMGHCSGIEECLRMFTAVEILDGENMVGCRRCWKIANGVFNSGLPENIGDEDEDSDSVDHDSNVAPVEETTNKSVKHRPTLSPLQPSLAHIPTSISTPTVSYFTHQNSSDRLSVSSLPTAISQTPESALGPNDGGLTTDPDFLGGSQATVTPGGLPIPFISTTAPAPESSIELCSSTARPTQSSFVKPELTGDHSASTVSPHPTTLSHLSAAERSKDSLLLPDPRRHRLKSDSESTDESSCGETESTLSTATHSVESLTSSGSPPTKPDLLAQSTLLSSVRTKQPPRPKPVIMRPAYKRYLIGAPPPVLVVHLKRFQQLSRTHVLSFSHGFKKLDDYVTFPEYLDLTPYLAPKKEDFGLGKKKVKSQGHRPKDVEKCMYRLYAVVVHIGNMLSGHYIAYTALPIRPPNQAQPPSPFTHHSSDSKPHTLQATVESARQWAYVSDTVVQLTTLEEVLKAKAYICMYERV